MKDYCWYLRMADVFNFLMTPWDIPVWGMLCYRGYNYFIQKCARKHPHHWGPPIESVNADSSK